MTEQLSPEELQRIHDEISGAAGPSVSSAIVNAEPSFTQTHPLTMAAISGELEPVAGLAQWIGIHEPARYLHGIEQEARATGRPGVGAAKMAGELGSLLLGGELSQGAKYAAETNPLMTGAITGGVTSAVMPTEMKEGENYSDFLKHKATDIAEGAALGGAFGKGSQLLFAPIVGQKIKALKDIGMTQFTPGQLLSDVPLIGPWIRGGEETLSSVPFLGDLIRGGRQNAVEDFNKAIANHVLSPMREATNQSTKVGHELADEVYNKVTNAYNEIAPELQLNAKFKNPETKQTTLATLNNALKDITSNLTPEDARSVTSAYKKFIIDPLKSDLTMDGVKFRQAESNLGKAAYSSYRKGNTDMGGAFRELQSHLRGVLAEQNPDKAAELSGIHESFKRWLRLESAASKRGTEAGVFDPAQFASAVESLGGKNATARGKALMQEQADAAEAILGKKVPDSGTARRLMSGALLAGGPSVLAGVPLAPTLAALPAYSKLGMKYLTKFATERPKFDIFGKKIDMRELSPQIQTAASTAGGAETNNYKEGGLLDKFKKKSKKYAKGGIVKLAGGGTSEAFDQAKQNVIDTYETAKDLISNPTPYLNKFKQIPGIINDPAEPISHYLKGDISGGIARANEALSERSPEELAMGFAQPGAMGIVGSIKNAGGMFANANRTIDHQISDMWKPINPAAADYRIGNENIERPNDKNAIVLNDWVNTKVKKYVRNQLGSADDPILKAIDSGVEHNFTPADDFATVGVASKRRFVGKPESGVAKTDLGKDWENLVDSKFKVYDADEIRKFLKSEDQRASITREPEDVINARKKEHLSNEYDIHLTDDQIKDFESIHNIPDKFIYSISGNLTNALGLNHVSDVLYEDLSNGKLTPKQMEQMSIEKAIRHTADYDAKKAKIASKAEADVIKDLPVHREYDNGYKWIELKHPTDPAITKKALESEGDQMGICVGTHPEYYEGVMNGSKRIFSLRDTNNKPHTTVEVQKKPLSFTDASNVMGEEAANALLNSVEHSKDFSKKVKDMYPELDIEDIGQIKGKGNERPKNTYQPYIEDFIKNPINQHYRNIHELYNTDLISAKDVKSNGLYSWEHGDTLSNIILNDPSFKEAAKLAYPEDTYKYGNMNTVPEIEEWSKQDHLNKKEMLNNMMSELQNKNMPYFSVNDLINHIRENHLPAQKRAKGGLLAKFKKK